MIWGGEGCSLLLAAFHPGNRADSSSERPPQTKALTGGSQAWYTDGVGARVYGQGTRGICQGSDSSGRQENGLVPHMLSSCKWGAVAFLPVCLAREN